MTNVLTLPVRPECPPKLRSSVGGCIEGFYTPFVPFVASSIVARGARFYLLAIICKIFGEHIKDSFHKYFGLILLFTVVIIILIVWLFT